MNRFQLASVVGLFPLLLAVPTDAVQKPIVVQEIRLDSQGAAGSFQDLWKRSDVVIEGVIEGEEPGDYTSGGKLRVHTMHHVRVLAAFKTTGRLTGASSVIKVRRAGGRRDLADRVEVHTVLGFEPFKIGDRYFMFLRETEWVQPAPHSGVYYYGTTYSGPDSFYRVEASSLLTSSRTATAAQLASLDPEQFRAQLRRAGGGK